MKRPLPSRRAFSVSSVTTSVVVHGAVLAGVVALGAWAVKSDAPRRVYHLEFERSAARESVAAVEPEELDAVDASLPKGADLDARLLRERVQPEALRDDPIDEVDISNVDFWRSSSEVVFGSPLAKNEVEPNEADQVAPAEVTEQADQGEPTVAPDPEVAAETPSAPAAAPALAPARIEGQDPAYPKASLRIGEQGDVVLRLAIDLDGRVTLVELESSSGSRRLDQAAMSAAPTWRFAVTGAMPTSFRHTVHFRLER